MIGGRGRAVAAALLLLVFAALPAAAVEVFTVGPVPVDATAQTATAARDAGIREGERKAFRLLGERLVPAADWAKLPRADDAALSNMVQDFSVANERTSTVRYLADYTFRFRPDPVRRTLRQAGLSFAETPSKPVVVVPVLQRDGAPVLWDGVNPWRDAWGSRKTFEGLVPLIAPTGDLRDVEAIDAPQAVQNDGAALAKLAAVHGAGDGLLTIATIKPDGSVETVTTRAGGTTGPRNLRQSWKPNPGEGEADFLVRVANGVAAEVQEAWKRENLLRFGQDATLTAVVPLSDLADWVAVRDGLSGIAAVRRWELVSMTKQEAKLDIQYVGDPGQLRLALAQRDLALEEGSPFWTLRRRGARTR